MKKCAYFRKSITIRLRAVAQIGSELAVFFWSVLYYILRWNLLKVFHQRAPFGVQKKRLENLNVTILWSKISKVLFSRKVLTQSLMALSADRPDGAIFPIVFSNNTTLKETQFPLCLICYVTLLSLLPDWRVTYFSLVLQETFMCKAAGKSMSHSPSMHLFGIKTMHPFAVIAVIKPSKTPFPVDTLVDMCISTQTHKHTRTHTGLLKR